MFKDILRGNTTVCRASTPIQPAINPVCSEFVNTATMGRQRAAAGKGGGMGNNELQVFVLGIMTARNLKPMDLHRLTKISRRTLTEITKGRYNLGSERTRETLEKLADGLGVSRAEILEVAGLDPNPPEPSTVPLEMLARVREAKLRLDEAYDALAALYEAQGYRVPPPPPSPPSGSRTPRKRPPQNGPEGNSRKGTPGKSS